MDTLGRDAALTVTEFNSAIADCSSLVHKCLSGTLKVPDFQHLVRIIEEVFARVEPNRGGANADYIPQLATVDPEQFAISITTTDGQHYSMGNSDTQFCIQSCSKPISYLIALDKFGKAKVHHHVSTEPSGRPFNAMVLKDAPSPDNPGRQIPHNPCINAGAIMTVSMVYPDVPDNRQRLDMYLENLRQLSAAEMFPQDPIGYSEETYKSESSSASRNWCLSYMMLENGAFPECFLRHSGETKDKDNLSDTLELYFQFCSVLSTNRAMSVMAATLANGGLNPWSEKIICRSENVRCVLPVMLSSGMYDYSGQWAYEVGVPAKSGVGGCIFMIVPNVCGIAVWSPRLNGEGNSVRGVAVAEELVKYLQLHAFEVFGGCSGKMDPTRNKNAQAEESLNELLYAASVGDLHVMKKHYDLGLDLFMGDYDARTAMHLAATQGHEQCLKFLLDCMPDAQRSALINKEDRWQGTPLDDAQINKHTSCIDILKAAGATQGHCKYRKEDIHNQLHDTLPAAARRKATPTEDPDVIAAAARGDLDYIIKCSVRGVDLGYDHHDYDLRTPLHLAASNGHLAVVKYLVGHARKPPRGGQARKQNRSLTMINAVDFLGNTALDDAQREKHMDVCTFLQQQIKELGENTSA